MGWSVRQIGAATSLTVCIALSAVSVVTLVDSFQTTMTPVVIEEPAPQPGDTSLAAVIESLPPVVIESVPPAGKPIAAASPAAAPTWPKDVIAIPALRIKARVVPVTIRGGEVPVPTDPATLGLTTDGVRPCSAKGTTLVVGHVSSGGVKGALYPLAATTKGTRLYVACDNGERATYQAVRSPAVTRKEALDPHLNTNAGPHRLVIITCGGPLRTDPITGQRNHRDNVVAQFVRVEEKR